jgi:hypothetical protein
VSSHRCGPPASVHRAREDECLPGCRSEWPQDRVLERVVASLPHLDGKARMVMQAGKANLPFTPHQPRPRREPLTNANVVNPKFVERQPKILRLRLPRNTRQTPLRMTPELRCELQTQETRSRPSITGHLLAARVSALPAASSNSSGSAHSQFPQPTPSL